MIWIHSASCASHRTSCQFRLRALVDSCSISRPAERPVRPVQRKKINTSPDRVCCGYFHFHIPIPIRISCCVIFPANHRPSSRLIAIQPGPSEAHPSIQAIQTIEAHSLPNIQTSQRALPFPFSTSPDFRVHPLLRPRRATTTLCHPSPTCLPFRERKTQQPDARSCIPFIGRTRPTQEAGIEPICFPPLCTMRRDLIAQSV